MIRRILGTAVTTLLVVAAVGLACWFVYSAYTGATLVTFRTGSMSPTMPQGAVAVTVPVTASDLAVGDVVTLQRAGDAMPVTHRIISISEVEVQPDNTADIRAAAPGSGPPDLASAHARQLVMQGDANAEVDRLPYAITDAHKVVLSLAHLGSAIMLIQTPIGMGSLILLVGALVVWAFWPGPADEGTQPGDRDGEDMPDPADGASPDESEQPPPARHTEEVRR